MDAELRGCRIERCGSIAGQVLGNRELLRRAVENVVRNCDPLFARKSVDPHFRAPE